MSVENYETLSAAREAERDVLLNEAARLWQKCRRMGFKLRIETVALPGEVPAIGMLDTEISVEPVRRQAAPIIRN